MADVGEPDDMADAGADAGKPGDAEADSGSADAWRPIDMPGDPHPSGPTPRSRPQRDHDAFKRGLRTLLDSGVLGSRHKAAPHLVITVGLAALHDEPGALPATLSNGTSLPAGLVRRLLADSYLTRVVLSLGRRVLETSHTERTLKAHERTALLTRWGSRCAGAGCTSQPGTPLIPHHANPWHRTGTTSLIDSIPFCASTHHDIHEGKLIIQLRDGRYLGPDGWASGPGP